MFPFKKKTLFSVSKPSDLWALPKMSKLFKNNVRDPRSHDLEINKLGQSRGQGHNWGQPSIIIYFYFTQNLIRYKQLHGGRVSGVVVLWLGGIVLQKCGGYVVDRRT